MREGANIAFSIVVETALDIERFLTADKTMVSGEHWERYLLTLKRWPISLWKLPSTSSDIHCEKKSRSTASRDKVTRSEARWFSEQRSSRG